MMTWQLQEAKSRFSQLVNRALADGPQIVTRHGEAVVVVLALDEYRQLVAPQPNLLDLLLAAPLADAGLEIRRDKEEFGRDWFLTE